MLSRVADSLLWMSRYVERAENIVRYIDVNRQLMLDLPSSQAQKLERDWTKVVSCFGEDETFASRRRKPSSAAVTEFFIFDRQNSNSVLSCLAAARENARTVREQMSPDMWEQLNRTYLWCLSKGARQSYQRNHYEFFQRVKKTLQLFWGITNTTMMHGDGWDFIQIGSLLERADKTSRLLDDEYHLLTGQDSLIQWSAVLASCNARLIYRRLYASAVDPVRVSELLLLNEFVPRSVRFCVQHLDEALRNLSGVRPGQFSNQAEKLSGRLLSELSFSSIDDLCAPGLHASMDALQVQLNEIGAAIRATYIHQILPKEEARVAKHDLVPQ